MILKVPYEFFHALFVIATHSVELMYNIFHTLSCLRTFLLVYLGYFSQGIRLFLLGAAYDVYGFRVYIIELGCLLRLFPVEGASSC